MTGDARDTGPERSRLSPHILPTAGTLLGICATLIGLVKIVEARIGPSHVDEYGGLVAVIFLISVLCSYAAIRTEGRWAISVIFERVADAFFIVGLISLSGVALFFAYELI